MVTVLETSNLFNCWTKPSFGLIGLEADTVDNAYDARKFHIKCNIVSTLHCNLFQRHCLIQNQIRQDAGCWPGNMWKSDQGVLFRLEFKILHILHYKDKSSSHITVFWIMVQYCFVKDSSAKGRRDTFRFWGQLLDRTRPGDNNVKPTVWFKPPYRYWLDTRNSAGLFHHVFIYMGDLHLFLPAMNLHDIGVSPFLLGLIRVLNWVELGWRWA